MLANPRLEDAAPWKKRYRVPILMPQVASAASARGLVVSNETGLFQLYAWETDIGALTQLTDRPEGTLWGRISPDGRYVYYLDDQQGNETGHFVRVPFEGGPPQDMTPDLPLYSTFDEAFSLDGVLFGFILPGDASFDLYAVTLEPDGIVGVPRRLYQSKGLATAPCLSHDGDLAVLATTERTGTLHYSLLAIDTHTGEQVGEMWDGPESSIEPSAFAPLAGDTRLLATTNVSGVKRPLIWDPRAGTRTDVALADLEGEVEAWDWSPDGQRLLLCQMTRARQHLYLYSLSGARLTRLDHPSGTLGDAAFRPDGEIWVRWEDAVHPRQMIALDGVTGRQTRIVLESDAVSAGHAWRSVTFPSSDGQEIQGWLATPDGAGPFPTILETHGGPTAVAMERFVPSSQAWLDHGFAYLTINYRGSTTFGRDFERQIWGDLGHWEVEDMVAARDWLVRQGIAHPHTFLLTGWSYGGYLTLQALGTHPELWAAGMGGVVVADWVAQYEDETEMLRGYDVALFGGTPADKPEQYAASSPLSYVEGVRAPVLIIQGRNDTRDPPRQVVMYEEKMRALGKSIVVEWFETGHAGSFANVELAISHQELMLRFAYRALAAH